MKKLLSILLCALLALSAFALGEGEMLPPFDPDAYEYLEMPAPLEQAILGDWYAEFQGVAIKLTLTDEGAYTLSVPGAESVGDIWELKDGMLYLEGNEEPLLPLDEALIWITVNLVFRREAPAVYKPAEAYKAASVEVYNGYWNAHFTQVGSAKDKSKRPAVRSVQTGGSVILSSAIGDDTALYIENGKAALAGKLFGRQIVEFVFENGALTAKVEGGKVTLQLQEDGFLRLTYASKDETKLIYLLPAPDPYAEAE